MRTLKTISTILPMTLLLACGSGGGGGYSALPTPTVTPDPVEETGVFQASVVEIDEASIEEEARKLKPGEKKEKKVNNIKGVEDKIPEKPDERTTELPNNDNTPTTVPDEPVVSYEFKDLGKWNRGIKDGRNEFTFGFNGDGLPEIKGLQSSTIVKDNDDFAGATYTGETFVERLDDKEIVAGKASATINGSATAVDFQFTELDGVKDIRFDDVQITRGYWETHDEVGGASTFELYKDSDGKHYLKGISATFTGRNDEFLGGSFYDWEANAGKGVFGTAKQP